jgi:hypothetical protein
MHQKFPTPRCHEYLPLVNITTVINKYLPLVNIHNNKIL